MSFEKKTGKKQLVPDGVNSDFETSVVYVIYSFVVRVLVRDEDGTTNVITVRIRTSSEEWLIEVIVDVIRQRVVTC